MAAMTPKKGPTPPVPPVSAEETPSDNEETIPLLHTDYDTTEGGGEDDDADVDAQIGKLLAEQGDGGGDTLLPEEIQATLDEIQMWPGEGGGEGYGYNVRSPINAESPWAAHHSGPRHGPEPFNPNSYTTFNFKLRKLYNLRSASSESTGDYIVRICFMGRVLGEYSSGPVDLVALSQLSRNSQRISKHQHCPSLTLGHELSMHLRFRDLLDNPVLLTLAVGGTTEDGEPHPPFAYTCLNIIQLVDNEGGGSKVTQLWILFPERTPPALVCGFPLISLNILGFTGLPTEAQLQQGNVMSVVIESMYRLPPEILKLAENPHMAPNMDIHFQLPHFDTNPESEYESTMVFPGGEFKKMLASRAVPEADADTVDKRKAPRPRTSKSSISQFTAVPSNAARLSTKGAPSTAASAFNLEPKQEPEEQESPSRGGQRGYRHWASVLDYFPDVPYAASIVSGKQKIPRIRETIEAIGDIETSGDSWRKQLTSGDTRVVWNSLHRHYVGMEAYKEMLEQLSKQTIWPLEVAVTIQQSNKASGHVHASGASMPPPPKLHSQHRSRHSASAADGLAQTVVVYHGVAFVDLTPLLYPGTRQARFIYQLFPFNQVLFKARTRAMTSAFLQTIHRHSIDDSPVDPTLAANTKANAGAATAPPPTPTSAGGHQKRKSITPKQVQHQQQQPQQQSRISNVTKHQPHQHQHPHPHANTTSHESKLTSNEDLNAIRIALLDESQMSSLPFIVFHIRLRQPLIPVVETFRAKDVTKPLKAEVGKFPRKRDAAGAASAEEQFQVAVMEASAFLSREFRTFLNSVVKDGVRKGYLDQRRLASSMEVAKKHFLFHLDASGKYLTLREHLRVAVSAIVKQHCAGMQPGVLEAEKDYQQFLYDLYLKVMEEMQITLNSAVKGTIGSITGSADHKNGEKVHKGKKQCHKRKKPEPRAASATSSDNGKLGGSGYKFQLKPKQAPKRAHKRHSRKTRERRKMLDQLLNFAQEAFAQGDRENAHRLHLERIARSGESSTCWSDFAVMWLARGDDRLAEVALREALLKNAKNIKALVLAGMIAARHADYRAILCLGTALNLCPNCPELMVLIGMVQACLGNDVASEYFFKKARFVHHVLTGQSVDQIEAEFHEAVGRMQAAAEAIHNIKEKSTWAPNNDNRDSPAVGEQEMTPSTFKFNENEDGGGAITTVGAKYVTYPGHESHEAADHAKSHQKDHYAFNQHYHFRAQTPVFNFTELVNDIKAGSKFRLPSMGSCLLQTWNVTKRPRESKPVTTASLKSHGVSQKSKLATTEQITKEFDRIASQEQTPAEGKDLTQIWVNPHKGTMERAGEDENTGESPTVTAAAGASARTRQSVDAGHQTRTKFGDPEPAEPKTQKSNIKSKSKTGGMDNVFTRRIGSEQLWTAHLLLKLRLFDFLDGVLARELAFHPENNVQVLYLRALSMYLRGRAAEAVGMLQEAIEIESKNGAVWALQGHCHYAQKMHRETLTAYERALKLPQSPGRQNLQLVYLRFGAQCLQRGKVNAARKVFLKGTTKFPSPYMWLALGNTCFHMNEFNQAEHAFAEANRLDPTNPTYWAHLALTSLALGNESLAQNAYRWAIRFGLKKGSRLMNELQHLQHREEQHCGTASSMIPDCIPYGYYIQRLNQENPLEEYKRALLFFEEVKPETKELQDTEREEELKRRLEGTKAVIDPSVFERLAKAREQKLEAGKNLHGQEQEPRKSSLPVPAPEEAEEEEEETAPVPPEPGAGRSRSKSKGKVSGRANSKKGGAGKKNKHK